MKQIWSAAHTDVGIKRKVNQDVAMLKVAGSKYGRVVFAAICDGMGGLQRGEEASDMLCCEYEKWFGNELPLLLKDGVTLETFRQSLERVTFAADSAMKQYAMAQNVQMGTTATLLLLVEDKYYVFHVGDSRIYRITGNHLEQLTTDHTYVRQQVQLGLMSEEQARVSDRKNVLIQCVGASPILKPDVFDGHICEETTFLLCSDGFYHEIRQKEIFEQLSPRSLRSEEMLQARLQLLTEWNKERGETDNISSVALKVF